MESRPSTEAIEACVSCIGEAHVVAEADALANWCANVSGLERDVPLVLRPSSTAEVKSLVLLANKFRFSLYPISCGKNWGLGSGLPPRDGTTILDLGRMNRIIEVNVDLHYAIVEPGVTQAQLHTYITTHDLPLVINITGAGLGTSLIGNALERGIGYFASRADELCALEVVLGNGDVIQTGHAHYSNAKTANVYRHGTGPALDGLFAQSNFGIVTRATVALMPEPAYRSSVVAQIDDDARLPLLVDRLANLRKHNVIRDVVHIGNRHRSLITLAPLLCKHLAGANGDGEEKHRQEAINILKREKFGSWSALVGLSGRESMVRSALQEVEAELCTVARLSVLDDRRLNGALSLFSRFRKVLPLARRKEAVLSAMAPLYHLTKGIPSNAPLDSLYWPLEGWTCDDHSEPDRDNCGMLYCLPFAPLTGAAASLLVAHAEPVFQKHEFVPYMTLNIVDSKILEGVVSLAFDKRDPKRTNAAHKCIEELQKRYVEEGLIPYRVGVQGMHQIIRENDPFWLTIRDLKEVLDPVGIIAPGRYNIK